jgi:tetratricopeptide (TPR) repeat protein
MWAVERREADLALRLAAALWRFWQRRGHLQEARERLDKALAMPGAVAFPGARAKALEAAGGILYWQGDMEGARRLYEESLALWRELGDKKHIANALYNLAFVFIVPRTEVDRGRSLIEQSLALYEELGDKSGIARTHWILANLAHYYKDYRAARAHLAVSLPIFRELESRFDLAWALHQVGLTEIRMGEQTAARVALNESLSLFEEAGDIPGIAVLLDDLSQLAVAEGDLERAARLAGKASALQASSGMDLATLINAAEGRSRPGETGTDQQALTAAWEEGRAMPTEEIVAYALQRPPAT